MSKAMHELPRTLPARRSILFVALPLVAACATRVVAPPPSPVPPPTAPAANTTTGDLPGLLIMPLKSELGLEVAARALDELILTAVHDIGRHRVLGPADLNAVLGVERLRDAMGCDEVSCAAEIGGALGAPFLVAGQLGRLGDQAVLSLRLMDTREPSVLARSSARGGTNGDALASMMGTTVGDLFKVKIKLPEKTVGAGPVAAAAPDYSEFTRITSALSARMMHNEYTELLTDLDRFEKAKVTSPPSFSLPELLSFYRVNACFMLKRPACVRTNGEDYIKRWPTGMYQVQIQNYIDQLEDMAFARDAKSDELKARLKEIADLQAKGTYDANLALELTAAAYMSAQHYTEATPVYLKLVDIYEGDPEKMLGLVQILGVAYEQTGKFAECRALLKRAQERYPKQFRIKGLHYQLNRLPK
jgi:hypothetical protein